MAHGYSVRQAVNEQEVYSALCAATKGYGGVIRFALRVGISRKYIHGMLSGSSRISAEVAGKLGYKLMWMRCEK